MASSTKSKIPRWLGKYDTIVSVYAERCAGPGWANQLYWCVVQDGNKKLRMEALQPDEMNEDLQLLFSLSAQMQSSLMSAVDKLVGGYKFQDKMKDPFAATMKALWPKGKKKKRAKKPK